MAEQAQHANPPLATPNWWPYIALLTGLIATSTAAIFIRLAQAEDTPSLVIAASRLCIASVVLTPVVLRRHRDELRKVGASDLKMSLLSGVMLSLHFATWITSLEYTAVVNSVVLVATTPLWVALMALLFLHEKLGRWTTIGLALALAGGVMVGLSGKVGEPPTRHAPLLGNSLALTGAIMVGVYFIIGRSLRARLSVIVYIWLVYSAAAIILVTVVIVTGQQVAGLPGKAYLWILMIGLGPQLIGHSSFNYALGFFSAAFVSLITLLEPMATGLLAIVFLSEWPVMWQLVGSTLVLVGIGAASRENQTTPAEER